MSTPVEIELAFEFDCPHNFIDLQACHRSSIPVEHDTWFQVYHPEHDEQNELPIMNEKARSLDSRLNKGSTRSITKKAALNSKDELEKEIRQFNKKRTAAPQPPQTKPFTRGKAMKIDVQEKENQRMVISDLTVEEELRRINSAVTDTRTIAPIRSFHLPKGTSDSDMNVNSSQARIQAKLAEYKLSKSEGLKCSKSSKSLTKSHFPKEKKAEDDLVSLLKRHNNQFSKSTSYEPSRHSVRDVRAWEKAKGKVWAHLSMEDRELANAEILAMKQNA